MHCKTYSVFTLSSFLQMLACKTRGFSFTRALLGISADELHLCGDPAAVPLVKEMLKVTDDVVEVWHFSYPICRMNFFFKLFMALSISYMKIEILS